MTAVLKTTENHSALHVKSINVITFGASHKFSLFLNPKTCLINK